MIKLNSKKVWGKIHYIVKGILKGDISQTCIHF